MPDIDSPGRPGQGGGDIYGKLMAYFAAAGRREASRLSASGAGEETVGAFRKICAEFAEYNASLELLGNSADFLVRDIQTLARAHGVSLSHDYLADLKKLKALLSKPPFSDLARNAVPRTLHPATRKVLEVPQLSRTTYHLLNNYILKRREHEDITDLLSEASPSYRHYPVIRDLRSLLPFYTILYVNHYQIDSQPAIQAIADALGALFGQPIEQTILNRKMVVAASIYRCDTEFQEGMALFHSQERHCARAFDETGLTPDTPARRAAFDLLEADRPSGIEALRALMDALAAKAPALAQDFAEIKRDLELGSRLVDKALANYRGFLSDPERRRIIEPSFVETIALKIVSGSDFLNAARFAQDIVIGFKDGEYSEHLFGTVLNALTTFQPDFVRCDSFDERRADLERSTQNRELALAKEFRDILLRTADGGLAPLAPPVAAAVLFYYRFLLGLLFRDKPRVHILRSQLDLIADSPSTPNDFGFFKRDRLSAEPAFTPALPAFERLASRYGVPAQSLIDASDSDKNPQIIANLQAWLFAQHVKKASSR